MNATAQVEFGKTLILSGLYEGVDVRGSSKTPVVGDVPGVNTFFNARSSTERRDVALVLLTPRLAGSVETDTREFRGETLNRLLSLWKNVIDPLSDMDSIIGLAGSKDKRSKLFEPKTGDLRMPPVSQRETMRAVIKDTIAQLR